MNAHVPALQRSLPDIVAEYEEKKAALPAAVKAIEAAVDTMKMAATVGGTYGQESIDARLPYESTLEKHLLKSAWRHVFDGLNIDVLATVKDKKKWEQAMAAPPEFTLDNIRGTFGHYIQDPRGNILRGLAEVFCDLDPYYKSHEKIKIGVKGLPKRVVLSYFSEYGSGHGVEQVKAILTALAALQGKPLPSYAEINHLVGSKAPCENYLTEARTHKDYRGEETFWPARGVWLKRYKNGNGHLYFDQDTLVDINKGLADFYGVVLGDASQPFPEEPRESKAVVKDLQFFWTPAKVIERMMDLTHHSALKGQLWLEPSCGDGRILEALRKAGARTYGVEYDAGRVAICKAKGFQVLHGNFLETVPQPKFDGVMMNPPFYGRHYAKHVRHALKFLKPGGLLLAVLPATARYDHGELEDLYANKSNWDGPWTDLPVASFAEAGTNVSTVIFKIRAQSN